MWTLVAFLGRAATTTGRAAGLGGRGGEVMGRLSWSLGSLFVIFVLGAFSVFAMPEMLGFNACYVTGFARGAVATVSDGIVDATFACYLHFT